MKEQGTIKDFQQAKVKIQMEFRGIQFYPQRKTMKYMKF